MKQLKMYWKPVPTEFPVLPEGWSVRTYNGSEADAQAGAGRFNQLLQQNARQLPDIPLRILGPSPYHIVMVKDRYRYKLTLKCRNDESFRTLLRKTAAEFLELPLAAKISISFDFHSDDN